MSLYLACSIYEVHVYVLCKCSLDEESYVRGLAM